MITQSLFRPAPGISNPHLQTLLPFLINNSSDRIFNQQTLELDDGDFIDLSWKGEPKNGSPIVVVFHGLEGSINSHYASAVMQTFQQHGWINVLMHFRGCSHRLNRLAHSYHSGETGDARYFLNWLKEKYPNSPLVAVGYSLGGNVLLKLIAEYGADSPLEAAVSVCAPVQLECCANRMNQGFSKLYQRHLISQLNQKVLKKSSQFDFEKLIGMSNNAIKQLKTFWQFDDLVTAPLNGFKDVHDYYHQSSSRQYLKEIKTPTLMIHALDDPFMTPDTIPYEKELSPSVELEVSRHGGHIGFVAGTLFKPVFWLQKRIPEYLSGFID